MSMAAACQTRPHADNTSPSRPEGGPLERLERRPHSRSIDRGRHRARPGRRRSARRACTPPAATAPSTRPARQGSRPAAATSWAWCSSKLRWRSSRGAMFTSSSKVWAASRSRTPARRRPPGSCRSSRPRSSSSSWWSRVEALDAGGGPPAPVPRGRGRPRRPPRPDASCTPATNPFTHRARRLGVAGAPDGDGGQPLGAGDHGPVDQSVDGGISGPFHGSNLARWPLGRTWRVLKRCRGGAGPARTPMSGRRRRPVRAPRRPRPGRPRRAIRRATRAWSARARASHVG